MFDFEGKTYLLLNPMRKPNDSKKFHVITFVVPQQKAGLHIEYNPAS